jgi:hypothetical protein
LRDRVGNVTAGVALYRRCRRTIAKAAATYPEALTAYDLRADTKRERGDAAGAERRRRKALEKENSSSFEHYGRIAALYFRPTGRGS